MITSASFMVGVQEYIGVAQLDTKKRTWYCYVLLNGHWHRGIGDFNTVPLCWRAVERALGLGDTRE